MAPLAADLKNTRAAVLTVSDSCFAKQRPDASGPALCRMLEAHGATVLARDIVPDDKAAIAKNFRRYAKKLKADLILSTGGTGLGPRDVTPEATRSVIAKEAAGLSELMRFESFKKTRRAALSRSVAGVLGEALIINLPGSPRAAVESLGILLDILPHALLMVKGGGH